MFVFLCGQVWGRDWKRIRRKAGDKTEVKAPRWTIISGHSANILATQCEEPTHWKSPLMLGKIESRRTIIFLFFSSLYLQLSDEIWSSSLNTQWQHCLKLSTARLVTQSCPTLCDAMDCSPPGSSVHGIPQARILEWVAISFSRGSSNPGIEPVSSVSPEMAGRFFITEPHGKP